MARRAPTLVQVWVRSRTLGLVRSSSRPGRRPPRRSVSATTARSWTSSRSRCSGMQAPGRPPSHPWCRCFRAQSKRFESRSGRPEAPMCPPDPWPLAFGSHPRRIPAAPWWRRASSRWGRSRTPAPSSHRAHHAAARARSTTWPSTTGATRSSTRPSPGSTRIGPSRSTSSRPAWWRTRAPRHSQRSASSRASASGADSPRRARSSSSWTALDSPPSWSVVRCSRSRCCRPGSSRHCCCSLGRSSRWSSSGSCSCGRSSSRRRRSGPTPPPQQAGIPPVANPGQQPPGGGGGQPTPTPAPGQTNPAAGADTDPRSGRCRDAA